MFYIVLPSRKLLNCLISIIVCIYTYICIYLGLSAHLYLDPPCACNRSSVILLTVPATPSASLLLLRSHLACILFNLLGILFACLFAYLFWFFMLLSLFVFLSRSFFHVIYIYIFLIRTGSRLKYFLCLFFWLGYHKFIQCSRQCFWPLPCCLWLMACFPYITSKSHRYKSQMHAISAVLGNWTTSLQRRNILTGWKNIVIGYNSIAV